MVQAALVEKPLSEIYNARQVRAKQPQTEVIH